MIVSLETPFRGVTACGVFFVRAFFKTLADDTKMERFADFVKSRSLPGLRECRDSAQPLLETEGAMKDFGRHLWQKFLETNWALDGDTQMAEGSADQIAEMFFDAAPYIEKTAKISGNQWSEKAVVQLDQKLMQFAESGETEMKIDLNPECKEELWRRWSYAIVALTLESKAGKRFSIPYPQGAPTLLVGTAVTLWVLGGPARDYPRGMFRDR